MYKRPNAPFKAPRSLAPTVEPSNSGKSTQYVEGLLSKLEGGITKLEQNQPSESTKSSDNDAIKGQRVVFKRVKHNPGLIRRSGIQQSEPVADNLQNVEPVLAPKELIYDKSDPGEETLDQEKKYYTVQWRKRSNKKNKSWEGDGYIVVTNSGISLRVQITDDSYKLVGRSKNTSLDGIFSIGVYEAAVDSETTKEELFGTCASTETKPLSETSKASGQPLIANAFKRHSVRRDSFGESSRIDISTDNDVIVSDIPGACSTPEHLNKLVLQQSSDACTKLVVVDEKLTRFLRQHQREGVSFLYECLMGIRNKEHFGALLADEMGLGKTLMTITLIWTLLKQSPLQNEKSVVNKVLVCCPVSLIDNWRKEFGKWLDLNRIGVLALNNKSLSASKDKQEILNFGRTKVYQVLIMNYEKVLACSSELSTVPVDLLVCDEGHRLKSSSNKVLKFLANLPVRRRLVLTGTPIQNDLNEFYNITNFINPGLLGTMAEFQKEFLKPITRARDVNCYDATIAQHGKEKSSLLIEITKSFTIRRTKAVIENYLTAKTDILIFCPPSKLQKRIFKFVIESMGLNSLANSGTREVLPTINVLRKVCNSPSLLSDDTFYRSLLDKASEVSPDLLPAALTSRTTGSKINVAIPLLLQFRNAGENVVIVSNFTQTLDLLERVLLKLNITYARLDGSTPLSTRDTLVSSFNKAKKYEVFLLSAKAGGIGLNLIGASRLLLFDNDWNPLVDLQAMARIHRDGQQRPVFIYRLFTTGSIDEKIFQRQLMKNNLSDMFLDDNLESSLNIFDYDDLRDLFTVAETSCNTHDLIDCECLGKGEEVDLSSNVVHETEISSSPSATQEDALEACRSSSSGWMSALQYKELDQSSFAKKNTIRSALSQYRHFDPQNLDDQVDTGDDILNAIIPKSKGDISYLFTYSRTQKR